MSGPADASLHEPDSGTCGISPTHNDCRKAARGGSPAQHQHPRRSTNRPAYGRRQSNGRPHRTTHVWTRISSTIPFYGWFGTEARISLALARPRINRRRGPEGYGCGRFGVRGRLRGASGSPHSTFDLLPRRSMLAGGIRDWRQLASLAGLLGVALM